MSRDRQQARTAARQREAEREARLRELQSLQVKVQDRVRSVDAYRQAHKADRLAEVRAELESTAQGLEREEEKLKVMQPIYVFLQLQQLHAAALTILHQVAYSF